jgi:hypothetical protein
MDILLGLSAGIFYLIWFAILSKKFYNLYKYDDITNDWQCKSIIEKMWAEKEFWFTNKGLDIFNHEIKKSKTDLAYYDLLEHTNGHIKKYSFLNSAMNAIEKDLIFTETHNKLGEKDKICFYFIGTLINICNKNTLTGSINSKLENYENRYNRIKDILE